MSIDSERHHQLRPTHGKRHAARRSNATAAAAAATTAAYYAAHGNDADEQGDRKRAGPLEASAVRGKTLADVAEQDGVRLVHVGDSGSSGSGVVGDAKGGGRPSGEEEEEEEEDGGYRGGFAVGSAQSGGSGKKGKTARRRPVSLVERAVPRPADAGTGREETVLATVMKQAVSTASTVSSAYAGSGAAAKMWARLLTFARHLTDSAQDHAYVRSIYVQAQQPPARVCILLAVAWFLDMQRLYCDLVIGLVYPTQGAYQSLKNVSAGRVQVGALVAWLQYFVFYALWTLLAERFVMVCGATFPDFYYVPKTLVLFALYRPRSTWMDWCFTRVLVPLIASQEHFVFRVMGQTLNMHVTGDPIAAAPEDDDDDDNDDEQRRHHSESDAEPPPRRTKKRVPGVVVVTDAPVKAAGRRRADRETPLRRKVVRREAEAQEEEEAEAATGRPQGAAKPRRVRSSERESLRSDPGAEPNAPPNAPREADGRSLPATLPEMFGQSARVMVHGLLGDLQQHMIARPGRGGGTHHYSAAGDYGNQRHRHDVHDTRDTHRVAPDMYRRRGPHDIEEANGHPPQRVWHHPVRRPGPFAQADEA